MMDRHFNLIEVTDYEVDFQLYQNVSKNWTYCLNFFPKQSEGMIRHEAITIHGIVNKIEGTDCIMIYGKDSYTAWEYAAESAMDVIEMLGFEVDASPHAFNILFWNEDSNTHVSKVGVFDGENFGLQRKK